MAEPRPEETLGAVLRSARTARGLSLRDVERRTGIRNAHLSQIETDTIAKPEMAILWDLASLYDVDFARLLALAGHAGGGETSGSQRRRTTVALRALAQLSPGDQEEALRFMAELQARRRGARPDEARRREGRPDEARRGEGGPDEARRREGRPDQAPRGEGRPDEARRREGRPDQARRGEGRPDEAPRDG